MLKNSISKTGHRRARPRGGWLRAAILTAGVAVASTANAAVDAGATIPGSMSGSVTIATPVRSSQLRQMATKTNWISHEDCLNDMQVTFTASVTTPQASKPLIAFVSRSVDDCLQNSVRNDPARCRPLQVVTSTATSAAPLVIFKAKAITELLGIPSCGDETTDAGVTTAPIALKFYFLLAPPAEDLLQDVANFAIYADSGIDLWGPAPPTSLKVTSGDEQLEVSFSGSPNAGDLLGYRFFIDDGRAAVVGSTGTSGSGGGASAANTSVGVTAGVGGSTSSSMAASTSSSGAGGAGGAGGATTAGVGGAPTGSTTASTSAATTSATGAGGVNASTTTGVNESTGAVGTGNSDVCNPTSDEAMCTKASFVLIPGEIPTIDEAGEDLTAATTETIGGLTNGEAYVVALAAVDDVGNVGALSELGCGTPAPVNSFLRVYRCKGGFAESGCGFCSMGGDRGGSFAALVSTGLVVFGFAARRGRRPRVASASRGVR